MSRFSITLFGLFISSVCASLAFSATTQSVPKDLLFNGQPIDSLCFSNLHDKNPNVDLQKCGAKEQKYQTKENSDMQKKGYLGFDWTNPNDPHDQGYSYYKFFPAGQNQYWIYSINNTGGSGEFTNIYLAKRSDDHTLSLDNIASGDRCNSGIQDVEYKNNKLKFSVNLTAYDLIALSNIKEQDLKAYDDLAACAVCCTAKAFYTVNSDKKPKFDYAQLVKETKLSELPTQGKYQSCFNDIFVSYTKNNQFSLNQEKLDEFVSKFKEKCIKS